MRLRIRRPHQVHPVGSDAAPLANVEPRNELHEVSGLERAEVIRIDRCVQATGGEISDLECTHAARLINPELAAERLPPDLCPLKLEDAEVLAQLVYGKRRTWAKVTMASPPRSSTYQLMRSSSRRSA